MQPRTKDGNDRDGVAPELRLCSGSITVFFHDDPRAMLAENLLDEIECKSAKSVLVGNAHLRYLSRHAPFQKLPEALAFEVETAGNIGVPAQPQPVNDAWIVETPSPSEASGMKTLLFYRP